MEAIASRLEAIALRLKALILDDIRLEAIESRLEAIAFGFLFYSFGSFYSYSIKVVKHGQKCLMGSFAGVEFSSALYVKSGHVKFQSP